MTRIRIFVLPAVAITAAIALTACGSSSGATSRSGNSMGSMGKTTATSNGGHNAADVAFATEMIPHHGQAIVMSDQVLAKTKVSSVRQLAEKIKQAQSPEITEMSDWLKAWSQPVPNPTSMAMAMDMTGMSGSDMNDMMSASQMNKLADASNANAARIFLSLMPLHHEGAIRMARTELADGQNAQAEALAQSIITTQTAEIIEMHHLLAGLNH